MPDREKVIGHLKDCMDASRRDNTWLFVRKDIVEDTIALLKEQEDLGTELTNAMELIHKKNERIEKLLKEQEAVEPEKENDGNPEPWTAWWYVCGDCGQPIDKMDRYCRRCGKQVKWE